MSMLADGIVFALIGGLTVVSGGSMIMRGGFGPGTGQPDRDRYGRDCPVVAARRAQVG